MMSPFTLEQYWVDPSRNQIKTTEQTIDIAPKAMAVLCVLAEHAGEVVSHDELMDRVWPNVVVGSNTLQRSIAQLRKALKDNVKQQSIISTHAKLGYCLVAPITFTDEPLDKSTSRQYLNKAYQVITMILVCAMFILLWLLEDEQPSRLMNGSQLTATDASETHARYSPSGQFIVFRRAIDACYGHLWAKNLRSGDEYQLTREKSVYGSVDWSDSGEQLTFMSKNHCGEQPQQAVCWQLNTLDFALALSEPQSPTTRIHCQSQPLAVARWVGNNQIAYLRETEKQGKQLVRLDIIKNDSDLVFNDKDSNLYSFDYSSATGSYAVISRQADHTNQIQHQVSRLDNLGTVLSSSMIKLGPHHSSYEYFNSYFAPDGDSLITYTDSGLYRLDFNGALSAMKSESMDRLSHPNLSPNGRQLVATKSSYDTDIALFNMNKSESYRVVARSNEAEYRARLSPNGQIVAFMSTRTGQRQIWYQQDEQIKQLSKQEHGVMLAGLVWSPNSQHLALVERDKLVTYDLEGGRQEYDLGAPVDRVLQWRNNQVLVLINQVLHDFNLTTSELKSAMSRLHGADLAIQWGYDLAQLGWLYLSDNTLFLSRSSHTQALTELTEQVRNQSWVVSGSSVYGIDKHNQLWRYDLVNQRLLTNLLKLPIEGKLNQVHEQQLLLTFNLSNRTELVEFDLVE